MALVECYYTPRGLTIRVCGWLKRKVVAVHAVIRLVSVGRGVFDVIGWWWCVCAKMEGRMENDGTVENRSNSTSRRYSD